MTILFWGMTILVMMAYFYVPAVCLYGIVSLQMGGSPSDIVRNPFFGLKKVSMKTGLIAWAIQIFYLGVILADVFMYFSRGTHPFFFDIFS